MAASAFEISLFVLAIELIPSALMVLLTRTKRIVRPIRMKFIVEMKKKSNYKTGIFPDIYDRSRSRDQELKVVPIWTRQNEPIFGPEYFNIHRTIENRQAPGSPECHGFSEILVPLLQKAEPSGDFVFQTPDFIGCRFLFSFLLSRKKNMDFSCMA